MAAEANVGPPLATMNDRWTNFILLLLFCCCFAVDLLFVCLFVCGQLTQFLFDKIAPAESKLSS